MKTCCRCGIERELTNFHKDKRLKSGLAGHCKICHDKTVRQWQQKNPEKAKEINFRAQERRRERKSETQKEYYRNNRQYYRDKAKEYKARPEGAKKYTPCPEKARVWRENNREALAYHRRLRKSRIRGSRVDFTKEDNEEVLKRFGGKCSLTGSPDIHMDHFIPVATGYGDTVIGNMIPLKASLNNSKYSNNPFEWIKGQEESIRENFKEVVIYLSEMNGMDIHEYEAHVYNCFD